MPSAPAMISARALGAMPDFVRSELGERSLAATLDHARLPHHIQDSQDGFILEESIIRFVDFAARRLGEDKLGLLLAPFLTVQEYGVWGDYVLSAPTVGNAMVRSCEAIRYHGSRDLLHVWTSGRQIRFSYVFARSGIEGYPDIAYCAVGVMLSLIRAYLGPAWSPASVALNIRKPARAHLVEEAFGCPVIYETPDVAIIFDRRLAAASGPPRAHRSIVTLDDVIRARSGGAPRAYPDVVMELIRGQLMDQTVDIERVAGSLGLGVRALQRRLNSDGVNFRELVNRVRIARATEFLRGSAESITTIAGELGYANSTHFTRAFKAAVGLSPRDFRRRRLAHQAPQGRD